MGEKKWGRQTKTKHVLRFSKNVFNAKIKNSQIIKYILWDKTVPAVVYLYSLEKSLTRFYNIFSSVSWWVLQISYMVCSAFSVYIGQ